MMIVIKKKIIIIIIIIIITITTTIIIIMMIIKSFVLIREKKVKSKLDNKNPFDTYYKTKNYNTKIIK